MTHINLHIKLYAIVGLIAAVACTLLLACSNKTQTPPTPSLDLAIAPYQDLAMIVNAKPLGLEQRYGVQLNIQTLAWENILPAVASAQGSSQVGFGSYVEFLTKEGRLNPAGSDPVEFIFPAYVFKGGAFVSFDPKVPMLTPEALRDPTIVRRFLSLRIGAQKGSIYEMMIYSLARRVGIDPRTLKVFDMPLNNALLAAQRGSLEVAEAGLTQGTEATKRGGRIVLTMEDMGFADITGFICKRSVLQNNRKAINALIQMWFDSVAYVMTDVDRHSASSLEYLNNNAATQYTLQQYKQALSQEYFPLSTSEAEAQIVATSGRFSYQHIGEEVASYLVAVGQVSSPPAMPQFIEP